MSTARLTASVYFSRPWSPWRAQLVNALADSVESLLVGEAPDHPVNDLVDLGLARSVRLDGRPRVLVESKPGGMQLVIAASDRLGLFSDTAGLLASHSVSVRSAALHTVDGVAVNTWRVDKQSPSDLPDQALLVQELGCGGDQPLPFPRPLPGGGRLGGS